jgi:NAD(P)-dependent dehydrogenase (short-subunit alcohol dehydrogenase family)
VQTTWEQPGAVESRSKIIPSRRPGYPDDIAQTVLFLASERAAYVNGAEVLVDGGFKHNLMTFVPRVGYENARS